MNYINDAFRDTLSSFYRIKPSNLALLVTGKCNARCIMCDIWKQGISHGSEMTIEQYETLLSDPFFSSVSSVVLSGGEALLRSDIVDIVELLVKKLPGLKRIMIASNGLASRLIGDKVQRIAVAGSDINITLQVSCDGVSAIHDTIRGPNAHVKVNETFKIINSLRKKYSNLQLSSPCVIQPINIDEALDVYKYLKGNDISPIFTVVCTNEHYYKNQAKDVIKFTDAQVRQVKEILEKISAKEANLGFKALYKDFIRMMDGKINSRSCPALRGTMTIEPNGNMIPCLNSGDVVLGNVLEKSAKEIWFSEETKKTAKELRAKKCGGCMFACGMGYIQVLKFAVGYYLAPSVRLKSGRN